MIQQKNETYDIISLKSAKLFQLIWIHQKNETKDFITKESRESFDAVSDNVNV